MGDEVTIYSDGGADPNPGWGGWAAVLRSGTREKEISGGVPNTTNNRMELTAALEALRALKRPCTIQFHTDSQYLRKGITEWIGKWQVNGWKRGPKNSQSVENVDLWQPLWEEAQRHTIEWHWVKGHAGNEMNERVDQLATAARIAITPIQAIPDDQLLIFARASYLGKQDVGGWAVVTVLPTGEVVEASGRAQQTTNNRMELTAVLEGIKLVPEGTAAHIFTVSDYVFQGATQWLPSWRKRNWLKKEGEPVANADLWQALDSAMRQSQLQWVNAKNQVMLHEALERAAQLANTAAQVI